MKLAGSLPFLLALAPLVPVGCVAESLPIGVLEGLTTGTDVGSSDSAEPSSDGGSGVVPPSDTDDDVAASSGSDTDASTGTTSDGPEDDGDCDVFDPSCPAGHKCVPYSSSGDPSWGWDDWGCFPLDEDPAAIGEPCELQEPLLSGADGCEEGSVCWNVNPETLVGTCSSFCVGSWREPTCADPDHFCDAGDGVPFLCVPTCDPLAQDCPPDQGCHPDGDWWSCQPHDWGPMDGYGEPCDFYSECAPGLVCHSSSALPPGLPCGNAVACCTDLCDLGDSLGDAQCTGAAQGQTCQPWYGAGEAPAGFENVGVCAMP